jgi:mRNA-degrading endonuclease toxin of MazEF toxin-antitoxin module
VWLAENLAAHGHAQRGIRPHVVVTQVSGQTVTVAPCTSQGKRQKEKYVVEIEPTAENGLDVISYVLLSQSFAADLSFFQKKISMLDQVEVLKYN